MKYSEEMNRGRSLLAGATATLFLALWLAPASAGQAEGATCAGIAATIVGTDGNDTISGTANTDVIYAGAGDDTVYAGAGNDLVCGASGVDRLLGEAGNDALLGGADGDGLYGGDGGDRLRGGPDNDLLAGEAGIDICGAGTGEDIGADCDNETAGRFGPDGRVLVTFPTTSAPQTLAPVLLRPDGRVVGAAGIGSPTDTSAYSLLSTGIADASFGGTGKVQVDLGNGDRANAAVLQTDGKLVTAGFAGPTFSGGTGDDVSLARFLSSGSLDPHFGTGGSALTDVGLNDGATAAVVQPDGKLVVVGYAGPPNRAVVLRYQSNGLLDQSFGDGGAVILDLGLQSSSGQDVALLPDGGIQMLAAREVLNTIELVLVRLTDTGALDTAFGSGGLVVTSAGTDAWFWGRAMALQSNGAILVAGVYRAGLAGPQDSMLARYLPSGALDSSFGTAGIKTFDLELPGGFGESFTDVLVQSNGRILAAGSTGDGAGTSLMRVNSNGSPDLSFGSSGVAVPATRVGVDGVYDPSIALSSDGRIFLAAGCVAGPNPPDMQGPTGILVARYSADGKLIR